MATNASAAFSQRKNKTVVVPIDLPGQPIQCWIGDAEKVKVILRKPRDVIFDIELCNGRLYNVKSESSHMYDVKIKKLIHPKQEVYFKDGEALHLQIGRDFKGKIFLCEGSNKLGEYDFANFSSGIVDADPLFKPAPISIVIKNDLVFGKKNTFEVMQLDGTFTPPTLSDHEMDKFVQVVELDISGRDVPREIADFFKKGGEKEITSSGGVVTRNWIMNQIVAQSGYVSDNLDWMKELWRDKLTLKSIDHKNAGRKVYVILTGSTQARRRITANRYSNINTKVLAFSFGARDANGLRHANWSAVKGNFSHGGLASILFTITLDVAEWSADYEQQDPVTGQPKQNISDLFIKIGIDVGKNSIGSAIASCTMWALLSLSGGAPLILVIVGTIVVSVFVGWTVDFFDKKYGGTEKLSEVVKRAPKKLEEKLQGDYEGYVKAISQALSNGGLHDAF